MVKPEPNAAPAPPERRLMARASLVVLPTVLLVALAAVLATLTLVRQDWLSCRVAEALVAAAVPAPGDTAARDALLRQGGIEAIRVNAPGSTLAVLGPEGPTVPSGTADLAGEPLLAAAWDAGSALFGADRLMRLTVPASRPGMDVTLLVHRAAMTAALRQAALALGVPILALSGLIALGMLAAFRAVMARPMGRMLRQLAAVGADTNHLRPMLDGPEVSRRCPFEAADGHLATIRRALRVGAWQRARLAALETAIGRLSHDLRGALSPAMLAAERLSGNADPIVVRTGDIVVRTVERATDLLREPLDLVREAPVGAARARGPLRPIVLEAAQRVRTAAPALRVDADLDEAVEIEAERDGLVCVFANLFRNAAAAGARDVRVACEPTPGAFAILIADNGGGLPPAILDAPFPAATAGRLGMGMPIVRQVMRAHRGEASVTSTGPEGTTIRLSFPATALRRRTGGQPAQGQQAPSPASGGRMPDR